MEDQTPGWKGWLMLLLLSLIWGTSFILIKRGLSGFAPVQVAILRLTITSIAFLPFALFHLRYFDRTKVPYFILTGLLGSALPSLFFALAQTKLPSAVAGIMNSLSPLFALIVGILWFGQKWKPLWLLGVALGLAGAVTLIVFQQDVNWGSGWEQYRYAGFAVLATLCYAGSVNIVKKFLQDIPSIRISSFSFLLVGMPVWLTIQPSGIPARLIEEPAALPALGYIVILALAGTVLATVIFYRLVQMTNVVFSSSVAYLIPVVAVILGVMDGEPFNTIQLFGMAMIISGVYLTKK